MLRSTPRSTLFPYTTLFRSERYGIFAPAAAGKEEVSVLENDKIKISFSSKGGRIIEAQLKDYKKIIEDSEMNEVETPLVLLEDDKDRFEYLFFSNNREISTQDLYFEPTIKDNQIRFRAKTSNGGFIEQIYTIIPESYQIEYQVQWDGIPVDQGKDVILNWQTYLEKLEKNTRFEKTYSTIHYKTVVIRSKRTKLTL